MRIITSVYGVQDSLRAAGSHLYRLAPLLLELARAFSGAVAAMQGQAGPLALNASSYIRPDGQSVAQLLPLLLQIASSCFESRRSNSPSQFGIPALWLHLT